MKTEPADAAASELLGWYARSRRDLPWRQTRDPYRILVSEVMLQQTQVDRVVTFYRNFLQQFPDERALAAASLDAMHRAWKGLGYPNRVERLQATCRAIIARGAWPDTPEGLEELPGIGPYTAGAVACFAFARAVPLVDTNVARVYARRDALALPLDKKQLWRHSAERVARADPIAFNNALMELGATICTARKPACGACPWSHRCASRDRAETHAASANPLKVATPRVAYGATITDAAKPRRHVVIALIHHEDRYLVAKRAADAHCANLWELPGGKREPGEDDRAALTRELREELGGELLAARSLLRFHHEYPDRYLTFHCYRCRLFNPGEIKPLASAELRWVSPEEFVNLEFPPANMPLIERMKRYHRIKNAT